jgi:hypothetical protein
LQIRGNWVLEGWQQVPTDSIKRTKQFDALLLVALDSNFDAVEIYEADREPVIVALEKPGSKVRSECGQLESPDSSESEGACGREQEVLPGSWGYNLRQAQGQK